MKIHSTHVKTCFLDHELVRDARRSVKQGIEVNVEPCQDGIEGKHLVIQSELPYELTIALSTKAAETKSQDQSFLLFCAR